MTRLGALWLSIAAFGLVLPTVASAATYPVHRPTVSPTMDGVIAADPAWQTIPVATGFRVLGDGYTTAKQSEVRICWDNEAIYVGFTAQEPDIARVHPQVIDGGETWLEDSMEVFLQPHPPTGPVFQFGVTAGGAKTGHEGFPDVTKCQAAAHRGEDYYSLELRLPWTVLGGAPKPGDRWAGTVCRNIWTTASGGDKFTSLSPLQRRFLEPENFAALVFSEQTLSAAVASERSQELNRDYRQSLVARVQELAAAGAVYRATLRSALTDEVYGARARELLRRWWRLDHLHRQADRAPLSDIRRVLADGRDLPRQSYDLKYRILLNQLPLD